MHRRLRLGAVAEGEPSCNVGARLRQAMLEMEGVADEPFGAEVLACLPTLPWAISAEELARRRDLRSSRCASLPWAPRVRSMLIVCSTGAF